MSGTAQRDDHTIAAEASRRRQALAGPGNRIEVTNFGESGYVTTQELIQLELELRAGNRPDVVVFYDGLNDVGTTLQYGAARIPQNESKRVSEFAMGRAIDRTGFTRGLRNRSDAEPPHYFRLMKELTLIGYFSSEIGCTKALRYVENPGSYDGNAPYKKGDRAWYDPSRRIG